MNMNLGRLKYIYCIVISLAFNVNASESLIGTAAEIKILDKITAKVTTVIISVNESNEVGSLIIKNYACYKKPPEQVPENFVLLKIEDNLQVSNRKIIYQGWMISSSPDTTPLEHPIYEVWLIDCKMESDF